jgi:biotin transport system substrate-specific component
VTAHPPLASARRSAAAAWRAALAATLLREALLVVASTFFLALTARIRVALPFTPVPLTGQTLGVLLVGALYGPRRGLAAIALYLLEGASGAPVFNGGAGGLAVLLGPTGGYLAGFLPAAAIAGWLAKPGGPFWLRFGGLLAATLAVYLIGVPWLAAAGGLPLPRAIVAGVLPFVPGDVLKAGLAAAVLPAGAAVVRRLVAQHLR